MSSFFVCSIAAVTLWDFAESGSFIISIRAMGTTCHDTPYLSLSQPHCCAASSPALGQLLPVMIHFFQLIWNEIAS